MPNESCHEGDALARHTIARGGPTKEQQPLIDQGRIGTGGTSPGPPGDPLTQVARCANGKSESPPGGSAGANGTRRPPPAPPCG